MTGSFATFRRTAAMRNGLLAWYPFSGRERVLDRTDGYLSELLRQRCGPVVTSPRDGDRFDLIVVVDPPDLSTAFLERCRGALAPDGRLLLAVENPFGLRYWAGHTSPRTGERYSTLLDTHPEHPCSRATLRDRLAAAGFATSDVSWYYPLADHWLCTEVYSDDLLPDELLRQRLVPYIDDDAGRRFDEHQLYPEVIRNGAFPFLCPSFLVEARASGDASACPVRYAAVTAYRPPDRRFATTIEADGHVYKRPLGRAALGGLRRLVNNHRALSALGVNVVDGRVARATDGTLVYRMPDVSSPTLEDHWASELQRGVLDIATMVRQFDLIRSAIWRAARSGVCYWELVPANCFVLDVDAGSDAALLFFDQEFCSPGVPPELALLRAVNSLQYCPALAASDELGELRGELLARYELDLPGSDYARQLQELDTYMAVFGQEHRDYQHLAIANRAALAARASE